VRITSFSERTLSIARSMPELLRRLRLALNQACPAL
jgi:hypothetical protein